MSDKSSISSSLRHYSGPSPADLANIPHVLKARDQWVLWCATDKLDKETGVVIGLNKIPFTAQGDQRASMTDPCTWTTYQRCVDALALVLEDWESKNPDAYRGGGLGYVLSPDDPFCGIDLDHTRDPVTGIIADWAQEIVTALGSYAQISVSRAGLHVIIDGQLPPGHCQDGDLQAWDHSRFLAMTGWHLPGTPPTIEPRQGPLETLWCASFAPSVGDMVWCLDEHGVIGNPVPWTILRIDSATEGIPYAQFAESVTGWRLSRCQRVPPTIATGQPLSPLMADEEIIKKANAAKNGEKFARLFVAGDWAGYASASEADLALSTMLAFWTQDAEQLNRIFEESALYRTQKWGKRSDYRQRTIAKALTLCSAYYQPPTTLQPGAGPLMGETLPSGGEEGDDHEAAPLKAAHEAANTLLQTLEIKADDAEKENAVLDAMPALTALDDIGWVRLKRKLKAAIPSLNLNDLTHIRHGLHNEAQQAGTAGQEASREDSPANGEGLAIEEKALRTDKQGIPYPDAGNLRMIFRGHPVWQGRLWWDVMRGLPMLDEAPLGEPAVFHAAAWCGDVLGMSLRHIRIVEQTMTSLCADTKRDLLQEYMRALPPWDGMERIRTWASDYCGATECAYTQFVCRSFLVAMVARAMDPGCMQRYVFVLCGPQNRGKSKLARCLGDPWYVDLGGTLDGKESHIGIQGVWLAELGELDAFNKTDWARLKSFVTMQNDVWIPKYSNFQKTVPRRTTLVGTTNEDEFYRDATGNTRFLALALGEDDFDLDSVARCRNQLFAEALAWWQQHTLDWWVIEDGLKEMVEAEQDKRRIPSPYEDHLRDWLDGVRKEGELPGKRCEEVSFAQMAEDYLFLPRGQWADRGLQTKIGQTMKALGWAKREKWNGGNRYRVWQRPPDDNVV